MDSVRRTTTVRQMELLVEFAEAHRDLALGRLRSKEGRALAVRLWRECAQILNSEGPARTDRQWTKVWNDTKCRVKSKLTAAAVARRGTGGGPLNNTTLTAIEDRVAVIIGHDVGPLPNVGQDQLVDATIDIADYSGEEENNNGDTNIIIDYIDEGTPGPSRLLPPLPPPPLPPVQASMSPSLLATPAPSLPPSSVTSTPRRRRQRPRQRARTGDRTRPSRIRLPAPTSRDVLDESRAMMLRIEDMRARTDHMLADAALTAAQAAKTQAEASLLQSQTVANFCQTLSSLMPAVRLYLQTLTGSERETAAETP